MKLDRITIRNVLGARDIDLRGLAPVQLLVGHNGAGKSSVRDALALALTADLCRVSLKKDIAALITEGASDAAIEIDSGGATYAVAISASGKIADSQAGRETPPALPFVLDASRFGRLTETERRAFLFGLLGVETTHIAIASRLVKRGCDADKVDAITPILRAGFDAGHKHAKEMASQARGAWKAATGEAYGEKKADGWTAPAAEPVPAETIQNAERMLSTVADNIEAANQRLGAMNAEVTRARQQASRIADLTARADKIGRIEDKLQRDQAELEQWSGRLAELPPAAGDVAPSPSLACPDCGVALVLVGGALQHYEAPKADDPDTAVKRKQWVDAVALYTRSVENGRRDLADAQAAAATLKEIISDPVPSETEFAAATRELETMKADRQRYAAELAELRARKAAADAAGEKTQAAARHHADVQQWSAIADALSPDGIPAEMVTEALDPLNKRLAEDADWAEWAVPRIGADMAITINGRAYGLLSESERWRADALIAAAIAHFSGLRLLVLDRFDVLDMKGREDLLFWLSGMADEGEIDTALVLGTLKAAPSALPDHCAAAWIERGTVQQPAQAMRQAA